jgi:hypothetical protein
VHTVEVGALAPEKLVGRLQTVCRAKALAVRRDALAHLADVTGHDVRSCLNTLQFVKSGFAREGEGENAAAVSSDVLARVAAGFKDRTKALLDVFSLVFRLSDAQRFAIGAASAAGVAAAAVAAATSGGGGAGRGAPARPSGALAGLEGLVDAADLAALDDESPAARARARLAE